METAIKKAIEGGYQSWVFGGDTVHAPHCNFFSIILLDPLFWQCLGKAEGWNPVGETVPSWDGGRVLHGEWLSYWHSFINHLAEGKEVESFFNELLK